MKKKPSKKKIKLSVKNLNFFVKELCNSVTVEQNRILISGVENINKAEDITEILLENTGLVQELFKKKFSEAKVRGLIRKSIAELKNRNKIKTWNNLKNIIIKLSLKQKLQKNYFIFPINISWPARLKVKKKIVKMFYIDGKQLKLLSFLDFQKSEFYCEEAQNQLGKRYPNTLDLSSYAYVLILSEGRDSQFTLEDAYDKIRKLTAILNLSLFFNKRIVHYFPQIKPISEIKSSPFGLMFSQKKKYLNYVYSDDTSFEKRKNLSDTEYKNFIKVYKIINSLNKEIKTLSFSALKNYQEAVAEKWKDISFSKYWTAFEILTLKTPKVKHYQLIERFERFTEVNDKIFLQRLRDIKNKRNKMLHGDEFEITALDVNCAKTAVEILLNSLVNLEIKSKRKLKNLLEKGWKK